MEDSTVQHGGTMNSNFQSIYAVEAELKKLMENDSTAHSDQDIDETLVAADEVMSTLCPDKIKKV